MKKSYILAAVSLLLAWLGAGAQVTSEPTPLMDNSENIVIFFHADQGNKGLAGQPASAQIYAHTGVITNKSTSDKDWKYAPSWGDNAPKYKMEYVSPNLWKLNIGTINAYYGITDPTVVVKKLAFVFRTADKSQEGKGPGNSDIFLNVYQTGAHIELTSTLQSPFAPVGEDVTLTAAATMAGKIEIFQGDEVVASVENATTLTHKFQMPSDDQSFSARLTTTSGETASSDAIRVFPLIPSTQATYPGGVPKMGAYWYPEGTTMVPDDHGSIIFCIAAPGKQSVSVVGSWTDYEVPQLMNYQDYQGQRYFWYILNSHPRVNWQQPQYYYFYVDGQYKVGDPYARLVLDPWNDKYIPESVYPNLPPYPYDKVNDVTIAVLPAYQNPGYNTYDWKVKDFKGASKDDLRIYELLFRDFTGTEGAANGNGTVRAAIDKIPYLKSLGINAVELLPINEFNGNISWGYNPNYYFAPDKAYGTPDDYKEFIDRCHQEGIAVILDVVFNQADWQHPWYQMYEVGQNPFFNATAPHAYSVLNDWNQGNPLVQKQWDDMLTYWLTEYKVDGFRFDLVKGLGDNSSYPNSGDSGTNQFNQSRIDRMHRLQQVIEKVNPNAYFINENLAGAQEENAMAAFGQLNWANINNAGCQYAMGYSSDSNLGRMYAPYDSRTWGSTVSYLESHDEQRLAYKQNQWGVSGVKGNLTVSMQRLGSCAAQMIMAPGSHMIWMFSEMGNDQNTKDNTGGNNTDPKIVNWDAMYVPQRADLISTYRSLHSIRQQTPELFAQSASFESKCNASDWARGRYMISRAGEKELYTVLNPNVSGSLAVSVPFTFKDNSRYRVVLQSAGSEVSFDAAAGVVNVPANCFVVIGTEDYSSGIDTIDADSASSADSVYATAGGIVIISDSDAAVYTAGGALVATSQGAGRRELRVAPGLYIVRTATKALKLVVR